MSLWKLALASLKHFWRTNLALLIGIAVGTAVLTGALIVGDSVRGSLKALTIERLGLIDDMLIGEQFFRRELVDSMKLPAAYSKAIPAILINQATAELDDSKKVARARGVTVVGAPPEFWSLGTNKQPKSPGEDQIVINASLAKQLDVKIGDRLLLRIGKPSAVATDSPLARKTDLVKTIVDLELIDIIPTEGLGRFSLEATQQVPANAFVSIETLQDGLDQDGKINAILFAGNAIDQSASKEEFEALTKSLKPSIDDLGLAFKRVTLSYTQDEKTSTVLEYDTLTNERMLFDPVHDSLVADSLKAWNPQPMYTYVTTKLQGLDADSKPTEPLVPYSTITAIDPNAELGPTLDSQGNPIEIATGHIVLNDWTAAELDVTVGDSIRVTYFEPETTHGDVVELSEDFILQAIVPITEPVRRFRPNRPALFEDPPTFANDHQLTPEVKGITDAASLRNWDAPFPMDNSLLDGSDDDYWEDYLTTPKAFISRADGQRLWKSRFGDTTSYRMPTDGASLDARKQELSEKLGQHYESFGMHWVRAKHDGLAASKGTTPFDALFLGFSQFIIASALMLVSLLLRLGMEQRASQLGLVGSLGFDWRRSFRLLLAENSAIVLLGSLLGVFLGIAYAWVMLAGLRTWWLAAVVTPFMRLVVTPRSLLIGFFLGIIASLLTIVFTLRRLRKTPLSTLLSGKTEELAVASNSKAMRPWMSYVPWVLLGLAFVMGAMAPSLPPEPQGGAFFGSGACVLIALLLWVSRSLKRASTTSSNSALNVNSLAIRNLTRNPTRSTLTIGLVAAACFLIVAISAFRLAPTDAGTGGFELVGQSDQPIFETPASGDATVYSLRLQDGDDASCRNLYQSARPRLIGITEDFIAGADNVGEMDWAGIDQSLVKSNATNWSVLSSIKDMQQDGAIPVVIDKNTAMYSMQIYTGVGTEFERDYGPAGVLKFRIVGLLSGSIFQGSLLVPEASLLEKFPRLGGYQYFLVDSADAAEFVSQAEEEFSDQGLDFVDSGDLLTELLAVQNTYLSTFQSLGGLGLLLGTFGLAAVQLRNVVQRRGELALLRATGFRNEQLSLLVLREHAWLLLGGLGVGILAALFVVLPHVVFGGATVPFVSLIGTLGLVVLAGLASGFFAQRYLKNMPLLPALRGD